MRNLFSLYEDASIGKSGNEMNMTCGHQYMVTSTTARTVLTTVRNLVYYVMYSTDSTANWHL